MSDKTPDQRFDEHLRKVVQSTHSRAPESQRLERLLHDYHSIHPKATWLQRLGDWFGGFPGAQAMVGGSLRVPAPALAIVALVVIAQSVALVTIMPTRQAESELYRGARVTDPCVVVPRIRAVFKPDSIHADVLILLRQIEARIVAVPSETGELWLAIPRERSISEALALLKSSPLVQEAIVVKSADKGCTPP